MYRSYTTPRRCRRPAARRFVRGVQSAARLSVSPSRLTSRRTYRQFDGSVGVWHNCDTHGSDVLTQAVHSAPCSNLHRMPRPLPCSLSGLVGRVVGVQAGSLTFTFAICYRPSVCRLQRSCALRRFKFSAIFLRHYVPWLPLKSNENFTDIVRGEPLRLES